MSKCVTCTFLNAVAEAEKRRTIKKVEGKDDVVVRHQPSEDVVEMLNKRRKRFTPAKHPNKFCNSHGVAPGIKMTGKATGLFARKP